MSTSFFNDTRLDGLQRGVFAPYARDAEFRTRFDYLISDMNTHPVHSLQYLRAILVDCSLSPTRRVDGRLRGWWHV